MVKVKAITSPTKKKKKILEQHIIQLTLGRFLMLCLTLSLQGLKENISSELQNSEQTKL